MYKNDNMYMYKNLLKAYYAINKLLLWYNTQAYCTIYGYSVNMLNWIFYDVYVMDQEIVVCRGNYNVPEITTNPVV